MSYIGSVWLRDISGNTINIVDDTDGMKNVGVAILQNVQADANNGTTTNILYGETWSGTSTSTLGVVGLQYSLKTDQNCTVYVDQSPDGTNWDIIDEYNYVSGENFGVTTQAISSYVRARIKNIGYTGTTYLRAQMALCPVVEAVPRSLSDDGRLKSESHITDPNDRHAWISRQNELLISHVYRLVGTSFNNSYYDTNFWLSGGTNGGTVLFDGEVQLQTSIDINI